jgi:hypothetical protein
MYWDGRIWLALLMDRIILVELRHAITRPAYVCQIRVNLLPPRSAKVVIFEGYVAESSGSVERAGSNGARAKLKTQYGISGIVDKCPGRIAKGFIFVALEEADEVI